MEDYLRILRLRCKDHYLFGNMEFDFTNNGEPVDTIIIAGENGSGKSTLLNIIYAVLGFSTDTIGGYEMDCQVGERIFTYYKDIGKEGFSHTRFSDRTRYDFATIYSDVAINYNKRQRITSVTDLNIDKVERSTKSGDNLAQEIEQLLIDIYDLDANEHFSECRDAKMRGTSTDDIPMERRVLRFTNAYNFMFGSKLKWKGVDNASGKSVCFENANGEKIPLSKLSSGEKQIVFRGGYLLKDKNALKGAVVLIDEPEISLHPEWQKKIMSYYKHIFTDENKVQTSQIFAVTHSPFIIHNDYRYNDKVIVLKRNESGKIVIEENPSYYHCNDIKVIEDAFNIQEFSKISRPTLFVEGRTDEMYIKKALNVYGMKAPFEVKWIGHLDDKGQEVNTGCTALNKAKEFLVAHGNKTILLYDCDTNKPNENFGNIFVRILPHFENTKEINRGIENALNLDKIDLKDFYTHKVSKGEYGEVKEISEFEKMKCCEYICSLDNETLKEVFANLKEVLQDLIELI